jgi:hypothetical protein
MLSRGGRRGVDRAQDPLVSGAATEVAHHPLAGLGVRGARVRAKERVGRDQLTRRADAALESAVLDERMLELRKLVPVRQAFDGEDRPSIDEDRGHEARGNHLPVELHRTRAAHADRATFLRPGEPEIVAKEVDEQALGRDARLARRAIELEPDQML